MTSNPPSLFFGKKKRIVRRRAGVSPVIATTIMIAITVVMGLALYSYTSSQTSAATKSFADEATNYINLKNDRFAIAGLAFRSPGDDPQKFTAYIFNSGERDLQINSALVSTTESSSTTDAFCTTDGIVHAKELAYVVFEPCAGVSFTGFDDSTATVYNVNISTINGSAQTYFQKFGGS